jgi:hypothetical protein
VQVGDATACREQTAKLASVAITDARSEIAKNRFDCARRVDSGDGVNENGNAPGVSDLRALGLASGLF